MKIELDSKKLRLLLIAGLLLSVVAFFVITVRGLAILEKKSSMLVDLKAQSQTAYGQLINLVQAKKEVEKYSYIKSVAKTVIPDDKNQAQAVLEINKMASQSGILIQNITFPASTLGGVGGTASKSAASTTTPATSSSSTALTQAKPVPGISGLYSLQLSITPSSGKDVIQSNKVTYPKFLDFLKRIENNRHTAQITEVSIQPASDSSDLTFTLVVNIFIKP